MQFKKYESVPDLIEGNIHSYTLNNNLNKLNWYVTELIDGDPLALYCDAKKGVYKGATKYRFLEDNENYSCAQLILELYKDFAFKFSELKKAPVIFYGMLMGGKYGDKKKGAHHVPTACEYAAYNDFIVHDIVINNVFIDLSELEKIAVKHTLNIAPVLYKGHADKCFNFPANLLSAVPFTTKLPTNYTNEMLGVVVRPSVEVTIGDFRVLSKKRNKLYVRTTKVNETKILEGINMTTIDNIAIEMENQAVNINVMGALSGFSNEFNQANINYLTGKYVKALLDKVIYHKYSLLTSDEKHLVHKELNNLARPKIIAIVRAKENAQLPVALKRL